MGRSISYPSNTLVLTFATYETGRTADADDVAEGYAETIGEWMDNPFAYDDMIEDFVETCKSHWPSLTACDEWVGREDHALLRNNFVMLGMSEYCGGIAYWIVLREDYLLDRLWYDGRDTTGLARRWAAQIEAQFIRYFGTHVKTGNMSNGEGVYAPIAA